MSLRVAIVDDEELGRRGVRSRLRRAGDVRIVAECGNGGEAVGAIRRTAPDLVFLDVQMPGMSGFEVIAALGPESLPRVIFVTAHDRYAVRAFEVHALDYLLKPIDDERFDAALARARVALSRERQLDLAGRVAARVREMHGLQEAREPAAARGMREMAERAATAELAADPGGGGARDAGRHPERFAVRLAGRVVLVPARDLDWVEAAGDYVRLHAGKKSWLLRETMTAIEGKLDPARFARIHRSAIVNLERIAEMKSYDNGDYLVLLADGTRLRLSRGYRQVLQQLLDGGL